MKFNAISARRNAEPPFLSAKVAGQRLSESRFLGGSIFRWKLVLLAATLSFTSSHAAAFGPTGHRVIAKICEANLSVRAKSSLQEILGLQKLAYAATWPDEMRTSTSDRALWAVTSKWHFVNIAKNETYATSVKSEDGDIIMAIRVFTSILKGLPIEKGPIRNALQGYFKDLDSPANQNKIKRFAVKYLVHTIGDLHQPLHAGYLNDRGGNDTPVKWFGQPNTLHWVWDRGLINKQKFSFTELADKLDAMPPGMKTHFQQGGVMQWLDESLALRKVVYDVDKYGSDFGYPYTYDNTPLINRQMQKAGFRAAMVFNQIFK
ncbi:MAG: S1/P1 nuclease [Algicola sp.]|nr:S1/P1 nuclease [Algicola sp.]